jgi:hypothetical protein
MQRSWQLALMKLQGKKLPPTMVQHYWRAQLKMPL